MRATGIEVLLGGRRGPAGSRGGGLWLEDGELVRGRRPRARARGPCRDTELAADAGLRLTESGAVAVDDALATVRPARCYAIGDCAGHPGAAGGLVQPGWEQAAVLASRLTGAGPQARYRGSGARHPAQGGRASS